MAFSSRKFALAFCFAAGLLWVRPSPGSSSQLIPLNIREAVLRPDLRYGGDVGQLSPSGDTLAYVYCDPKLAPGQNIMGSADVAGGVPGFIGGCRIKLVSTSGGQARSIGSDAFDAWDPQWAPDGTALAYLSNNGKASHLWIWDPQTGSARQVTPAHVDATIDHPYEWLANSWQIAVRLVGSHPSTPAGATLSRARKKGDKTTVTVFRPSAPSKSTGEAMVAEKGKGPNDIGVVNIRSGSVNRPARDVRCNALRTSPDGRKIAFFNVVGHLEPQFTTSVADIVVLDVTSGSTTTVVRSVKESEERFSWSPDSRWLAFLIDNSATKQQLNFVATEGSVGSNALGVVAGHGGAVMSFSGDQRLFRSDAPLWDSQSAGIYFASDTKLWRASMADRTVRAVAASNQRSIVRLVASGGRNVAHSSDRTILVLTRDTATMREGFARINPLTGEARQLTEDDVVVSGRPPIISVDGSVAVYELQAAGRPHDLWANNADFTSARRITVLDPALEKYAFGSSHLIQFTSNSGENLRASLLLPAGYQPGKRYPTIVWVYASDFGSHNVNHFGFWGDAVAVYNFQMYATRGYAVLWPDIPVHVGTPMADLMNSVMPAIDAAAHLGYVDPDRLALSGQSNGGYSTISLLVQTQRFKAAVMNAGFGDLAAFYAAMTPDGGTIWHPWLERWGGAMGAAPWQAPQRYIDNSPVYYLDRVTTPLIIQDGSADDGIVQYSDEVYTDLASMGKDVTYLRYGGESHVLESGPNMIDYWTRVLKFIGEHLHNPAR